MSKMPWLIAPTLTSIAFCVVLAWPTQALASLPPTLDDEAPRVQALLSQGWAAESGRGQGRSRSLASALYWQAGQMGSAEGYYRAALMAMPHGSRQAPKGMAICYLQAASQVGHQLAAALLERSEHRMQAACNDDYVMPVALFRFDLERYMASLPEPKHRVVQLIRKLAPQYSVDVRLALAVASAESNFNTQALSPKNAMGVMQLIPETAERFNVRNPFDAEQNVRGGLAYLRWLSKYFGGDMVRVIAAYNAGEKAVDRYGGMPPYRETIGYVTRVLAYSGIGLDRLPPTAAGPPVKN